MPAAMYLGAVVSCVANARRDQWYHITTAFSRGSGGFYTVTVSVKFAF